VGGGGRSAPGRAGFGGNQKKQRELDVGSKYRREKKNPGVGGPAWVGSENKNFGGAGPEKNLGGTGGQGGPDKKKNIPPSSQKGCRLNRGKAPGGTGATFIFTSAPKASHDAARGLPRGQGRGGPARLGGAGALDSILPGFGFGGKKNPGIFWGPGVSRFVGWGGPKTGDVGG